MKPTVLCVDDEMIVLEALNMELNDALGESCDVEIAESGEEALQLVRSLRKQGREITTVICDQLMPRMTGEELLKELSAFLPTTSLILLTGNADLNTVSSIVNRGRLDGFLLKPWSKGELIAVVKGAMATASLKRILEHERKQLLRNSVTLQWALKAAQSGVWEWFPLTGKMTFTTQWHDQFQHQPSATHGSFDFYESIVHPEDAPRMAAVRRNYLSGSITSHREEFRLRAADEEWHWVFSSGEVIEKDSDGRPLRVVGFDQDITERKATAFLLEKAKEKSDILANLSEQVTFLDTNFHVIWCNRNREGEQEEETGFVCYQKWHDRDTPCEKCPVCETLETHEVTGREVVEADGRAYARVASPVFGEDGEQLIGVILSSLDITEMKAMEAQLQHARKMESIGQLAAGIAHEINTPIQYVGDNTRFVQDAYSDIQTLIDTFQELLEHVQGEEGDSKKIEAAILANAQKVLDDCDVEYLSEEIPSALSQSLDGIDRVTEIVHAMKEFSHPGTPDMQATDLNRAINNTVTISRNEWKYVAEVDLNLEPDLPLVPCLPGELNQTLLNLLVNAAHAIEDAAARRQEEAADSSEITVPKMGRIGITTRTVGDYAEIEVSDTGIGIPRTIRDKVFDPFFTTKHVGRGTGQGLAVAYSIIVEKHKGMIEFETEDMVGTTFTIRLPIELSRSNEASEQPNGASSGVSAASLE